ncbi:MAG: MFS transporter [Coxiellaceae bacterium]|nr:MFS transporter [Coxiellaceae bacterium]
MRQQSILKLLPLFLVITIDSMGLGILFPIMSDLLINHHALFLPQATSDFMRELLYGITIGIYMIAWFFGSAILGDMSDSFGRKKSLMICLLGATLGYFISAVAILFHSLVFLIVGRVIAGFTAGSQPIAQAAIVDVSNDESRARNIGYVLLAVSLGFVLGPFAGGILSNANLVSWFNDAVPLFFAGVVSLLNCILLYFAFHETFKHTHVIKIRLSYAITIFKQAFESKRIRLLSIVLFIETVGWSEYYTFISQMLLRRFHYSVVEISFFMAVMALGFSIGFGFLVDPCAKHFNQKKCVLVTMPMAALLFFITAITNYAPALWIIACLIGMIVSIFYSILITLFSKQVNDDEQGWVMGITNSVGALSFGATALISGFVADWSPVMPIYLGGIMLLLAALILKRAHLTGAKLSHQ